MLDFITLFMFKKEAFECINTGYKAVELRRGKVNMVIMPSSNVEGTFSEGIFSNERKVV